MKRIDSFLAAAAAVAILAVAGHARADILFVDVNDQKVERDAAVEMARRHGQRIHVVTGNDKIESGLEEIYARAGRGEISLDTVVISGHSGGTSFFGKNGYLSYEKLKGLAERHPAANRQVRHFIGLGCYTGTPFSAAEWGTLFPSLTTASGFDGIGPSGVWSARFMSQVYGAIADARARAGSEDRLATRLAGDVTAMRDVKSALAALQAVKITNASFALCEQFYKTTGTPAPAALRTAVEDRTRSVFSSYYDGSYGYEDVPTDINAPSPLRSYYALVQSYLPVAPASERARLLELKDQALRLIYFVAVKKNWSRAHAADRAAANRALAGLGVQVPDGATLATTRRREVVELVTKLLEAEPKLGDGSDAEAARRVIAAAKRELLELKTPVEWID